MIRPSMGQFRGGIDRYPPVLGGVDSCTQTRGMVLTTSAIHDERPRVTVSDPIRTHSGGPAKSSAAGPGRPIPVTRTIEALHTYSVTPHLLQ
jgi:hypothetical protein